jgi:hypothetical protein
MSGGDLGTYRRRIRRVAIMISIHKSSIAGAALVVALSACRDSEIAVLEDSVAQLTVPGCDSRMWIGVRRNNAAPCPTLRATASGQWFALDPFASAAPAPNRAVEMCTYIWMPAADQTPSPQQLQQLMNLANGPTSPLTRIDQSCLTMSSMSDVITQALLPIANDTFFAQNDGLDPIPVGAVQRDRIQVAVVDSVPDGEGLMDSVHARHAHGRGVGLLIQELACPDPTACSMWLSTNLAFGRRDEDPAVPADERGAFVGRPAELAVAINRALDIWRQFAPSERLVINLSVGWYENTAPTAPSSALPVDAFSVLNALSEASCYGALIIAAAGNTTDGPSPDEGPLYPAAWEQRPTPTHDECWGEYGIATGDSVRSQTGPLLFSVGGVDGLDRPASNVRPGARPRLAAPAEHSAETDLMPFGNVFNSILSGSSVSAGVGTAAAAIAWSYRSSATATEIAELLYDGGEPLAGHYADYCAPGASCGLIHRISMCGVVQQACAAGGSTCPSSISCARRPAFSDSILHVPPAVVEYLSDNTFKLGEEPTITAYEPACDAEVTKPIGSSNIPCPNYQFANSISEPVNHPQPGEVPCRLCVLSRVEATNQYRLFVGITTVLPQGTSVSNGSMELILPNGTRRFYDLPLGTLYPGSEVQLPMTIEPSGFSKATISFLISGNGQIYSSKDPLVLD